MLYVEYRRKLNHTIIFNVALFAELINNDFLESTFFDNMNFSLPGIKKSIKNDIGLSNQGMVLISLYVLLVIPRQLIGDKFNEEYKEIGCWPVHNRKHKKVGHVFQGGYKAILIEKDSYLLELSS